MSSDLARLEVLVPRAGGCSARGAVAQAAALHGTAAPYNLEDRRRQTVAVIPLAIAQIAQRAWQ